MASQSKQITAAPAAETPEQKLTRWYDTVAKLDDLKSEELKLRNEIVAMYFPRGLEEGVNKVDMPSGWVLKATGKLNRSVDEAAIPAVSQELAKYGVSIDQVIRYKPDLSTTEYRKLTEQQRKVFDQCLTIKPGTPSLELTKPKR